MRTTLYVLSCFSLLVACSTREPVQILKGYETPFTTDKSLVYYYLRMPENDTTRTEFRTTYESGEKYVTEKSFVGDQPEGMRKFKVSAAGKELVEEFYYSVDSTTKALEAYKAEIVEYSNREDDNEYLTGKYEKVYRMWGGFSWRSISVEKFAGQQTYLYQGEEIPSIRFDTQYLIRSYNRFAPVIWWTEEYDGYVIFSRDIGLTYAWYKTGDKETEHKLIRWEVIE